jgi:hypothetical protein
VIVNRNGKDFFGALLADDVLIEHAFDLDRLRYVGRGADVFVVIAFLGNDVVAQIDALITNVNGRTGDQLANLILALSTEGTDKISRPVLTVLGHRTPG